MASIPLASRREILIGLAVGGLVECSPARARSARVGLSVAEPSKFRRHNEDAINRRFDAYRASGVEFLRTSVSFRQQERTGVWQSEDVTWLKLASRFGFRLRVQFEVLSGPPLWFLQDNPEAKLFNTSGNFSRNMISPFWRGSQQLVRDVTIKMANWWRENGYFEQTASVIADLGPAGEPLYPPAWTMGSGYTPASSSFWFFGIEPNRRFREWAVRRYGSTRDASRVWNMVDEETNWTNILRIETASPAQWHDILFWYFETKRALTEQQVALSKDIVQMNKSNADIVVLIPAARLGKIPMGAADFSRNDFYFLTIGADMDYNVRQAIKYGCTLQYTGLPNHSDILHIKELLRLQYNNISIWGENVGVEAISRQFELIVDQVAAESLTGYEYVGVESLFGPDGSSPTELLGKWKEKMRAVNSVRRQR